MLAPRPALAQSFSFSNVQIEGNERVDAATILSFAGIARGQTVSAGELNDAFQRIQGSGLFETVDLVPRGNTLIIRVREYPTINIINFEGNRRLRDEQLGQIVRSQSRRVYSPSQAEADAAAIAEAYREGGRLAATVEPRIIRRAGNRVDLVFEVREGRVTEIERLAFVGNRAFSDRRLRQVLDTKQAGFLRQLIQRDTFVADRLEFDKQLLRDFYQSRGFVDFEVLDASGEIARERDAVFVTFTIREGQSFRVGAVDVVSEIEGATAEEFRAVMRLRPGVVYSPSVIETNIARMENLALRKGLNFVRVEPRINRNDRDLTLDVTFAIVRGPRLFVERIDIEGNTTTLDQVVRRQFRTVEGDPFNPREIRQAAERIRALGFFRNANVEAEQGSSGDQVIVNVDLEEQPTGSLGFGVSYAVDSGVGLNISFAETNFLGRGQTVSVSVLTGTDNASATFSFLEPAFLGRDLAFGLDVYYSQTERRNALYDTRNIGIRPSISFPVGENSRLELRYRISKDEIRNVTTDSSAILQREGAQGSLLSSTIGYSYAYDTRRDGLNPNGGILLRFGQDFAGLGGDLQYIQTNVLALAERRILNEEVTVRAVFEGGAISMIKGNSRVTERFFGGQMRGFEGGGLGPRDLTAVNTDALGGNFFAVAKLESEFPIGLPEEYGIRGGLFLDVGSVWGLNDTAGTAGTVDDKLRLRASVGASIFWDTPIGPLRFNVSRALKKLPYDKEQKFDLTISTQF
ncbi:MAG TPA: outer membrane protein assembly factor BamA [Paracoccaceae bacterium]|nr:outer membrane protein assembly factor BamA [Paracoccaceae bacterium]